MKKTITAGLAVLFSIAALFANGQTDGTGSGGPKNTYVFKVAVNNPESHPMGQSWKKFGEILSKESEGRLTLDIFYGGQLGSKTTCIQGLQTGVIDMYMVPPNVLCDYGAEELKVLSFPYIFKSLDQARAFLKTPAADNLLDYIEKSGTRMVGLGWYQDLPRNYFFSHKVIKTVDDLKGLKLRCQASSIDLETMKCFGVTPVTVAFAELYSALQTGIVDGAEQPMTGFFSNQFQEVTKSMILDEHQIVPSIGLVSELTWNKLSESDRALIKKCFNESAAYWDTLIDRDQTELKQKIQNAGVEIVEPSDKDAWRVKVQPVYDKYGQQYKDLIDQIAAVK